MCLHLLLDRLRDHGLPLLPAVLDSESRRVSWERTFQEQIVEPLFPSGKPSKATTLKIAAARGECGDEPSRGGSRTTSASDAGDNSVSGRPGSSSSSSKQQRHYRRRRRRRRRRRL